MASPIFLVENFFNIHQYPTHAISANEEPVGTEGWRVGTGRRDTENNKWTPTTANNDAYLTAVCDRTRAADTIIMDGHNLGGENFRLRGSQDNFGSYDTLMNITIPPVSAPGSIDDPAGVLTEEGVWVKRFDTRAFAYWRPFIAAMGAGLRPEITGLWLGKSYSPGHRNRPADVEATTMFVAETVSEAGWHGRGPITRAQSGVFDIAMADFMEYDIARLHLNGLFAKGNPMWVFDDPYQADRGFCVVRPDARMGFFLGQKWGYEVAQIPYTEHQPSEDR